MAPDDGPPPRRTLPQQIGDAAEASVAADLERRGWQILARRLRIGRNEIDLLAVDPGPPSALVIVEVRWRRDRGFGLPEETFGGRKAARLRATAGALSGLDRLPDGRPVPRLRVRVDLVAVEPGFGPAAGPVRLRHHRDALAG